MGLRLQVKIKSQTEILPEVKKTNATPHAIGELNGTHIFSVLALV
jgi:hypothetical protein